MPFYQYKAFDREGKTKKGTIDASSTQGAKEQLRQKGLMVSSLVATDVSTGTKGFFGALFERRVDEKTKIRFTKQLGVLMGSGVPLVKAIEMLSAQFEGKMHRILIDVKDDLKEGRSFADSLSKYPRVFSSVYVQLVRAGEASGKLENIMARLNDYLIRREEIKKRIKSAMTYPLVLLSLAFAVVLGMMLFLVPMFEGMFKDMNIEPPALTQVMLSSSHFLQNYYLYLMGGIALFIVLFMMWKRSPGGKQTLDRLALRLPFTSYFAKTKAVVQFSSTLGMLLDSGVNLAEALDIVCNIIDNSVLIESVKNAREKIIQQGKIAYYLQQTGIFPPIASYMISTGEQSGNLAEMLLSVGEDYEEELSELIDGLIAKINPIMLLVIGSVVILVVASLFMPMFDFMETISDESLGGM